MEFMPVLFSRFGASAMETHMHRLEKAARLSLGHEEPARADSGMTLGWTAERTLFLIAVIAVSGFVSFGFF